jgi:hypothetical protein
MRIGIDISQIVHEGTGVATYVKNIVKTLIDSDTKNQYILFGASLRKRSVFSQYVKTLKRPVTLVASPLPPTLLDILWNVLHIAPIQWFIGPVDVFWSSDWTQPPLGSARGMTTIHDLTILRFPESFASKIVTVQKRRLMRAIKSCDLFLCDSKATQKDVIELLHIHAKKTHLVYPGYKI